MGHPVYAYYAKILIVARSTITFTKTLIKLFYNVHVFL